MQIYKSVGELKRNLPQVLERIKHCRLLSDAEWFIMQSGIDMFVKQLTTGTDYGYIASHKSVSESYKNALLYQQEAEYLQGLVDKLKNYKEHNI